MKRLAITAALAVMALPAFLLSAEAQNGGNPPPPLTSDTGPRAPDTAGPAANTGENAKTQTQADMEADGKKTQADKKTAPTRDNGGGSNNAGGSNNNGNAADQFDPIKGSTTGQP